MQAFEENRKSESEVSPRAVSGVSAPAPGAAVAARARLSPRLDQAVGSAAPLGASACRSLSARTVAGASGAGRGRTSFGYSASDFAGSAYVPHQKICKKQAKARARRRRPAAERLQRDHTQAQRAIEALEQALHDSGLPDNLVQEIEGRRRRQQRLLGKIFGVMFPSLFGCRTPSELARVHGWGKNVPPQLLRRWRRRQWIEYCFRTLKHLWATEACQVHSEDAYYGHWVLRLMGCFVLFYTTRVICKGRMTVAEIVCSLKHYWRFVDSEALALPGLSWGTEQNVA